MPAAAAALLLLLIRVLQLARIEWNGWGYVGLPARLSIYYWFFAMDRRDRVSEAFPHWLTYTRLCIGIYWIGVSVQEIMYWLADGWTDGGL